MTFFRILFCGLFLFMVLPGTLLADEYDCSCDSAAIDANILQYVSKCSLSFDGQCKISECKPDACFFWYSKTEKFTCLPGGKRDEDGWCIDGQVCDCDPAYVGAKTCKIDGLNCEPKECKKNYCALNGNCVPGVVVGAGEVGDVCDCATFNVEHGKQCHFVQKEDCLVCAPLTCEGEYSPYDIQCVQDRAAVIENVEKHDRTTNPNEYTIDPREYVNWGNGNCPEPYDRMLLMIQPGSDNDHDVWCTAEYIASNIILTAQHCVVDDNNDIWAGKEINYLDCHGRQFKASVMSYGDNDIYKGEDNAWGDHSVPVDWALLSVNDSKFYNNTMFDLMDVAANSTTIVNNAGWGVIPILSDQQIKDLRQSFTAFVQELKASDGDFSDFQRSFISISDNTLKVHKGCVLSAYNKYEESADYHSSTCYSWGGNSGGPYYTNNNVIGIVSGGMRNLPDEEVDDVVVPTVQYISQEQKKCNSATGTQWHNNFCSCKDMDKVWQGNNCECIGEGYVIDIGTGKCVLPPKPISPEQKSCEKDVAVKSGAKWNGSSCECSVATTSWKGEKCVCADPNKTVQDGSCKTSPRRRELEKAKEEVRNKCFDKQKLETMSDYNFLACMGQIVNIKELEENYANARKNETSLKNRVVSGLTMAATGIGGMQLAQGLAEQKADADAERDMQAYLATFQCRVGNEVYSGGKKGIETGGANQLINLYTQYKDLAADLKERKTALGMKAGIESEVILDKADAGLYNNAGHGIENGTYASLYRASMGNEADQTKLQENKAESQKRVNIGAAVGGGGAVVGAVANNIDLSSVGSSLGDAIGNMGSGTNLDLSSFTDGLGDAMGDVDLGTVVNTVRSRTGK